MTVTRLPPPRDHVWIINTELSPALQSTVNTGADHADGWIQRVEADRNMNMWCGAVPGLRGVVLGPAGFLMDICSG